jgi:hypothetical protein
MNADYYSIGAILGLLGLVITLIVFKIKKEDYQTRTNTACNNVEYGNQFDLLNEEGDGMTSPENIVPDGGFTDPDYTALGSIGSIDYPPVNYDFGMKQYMGLGPSSLQYSKSGNYGGRYRFRRYLEQPKI